ncbi:MAG TPA: DsbA family protein [Geminicoccus sp.]|jgi:2-hydroxychromene-2-carboxylate isomerase|uniref:DsbA family protein n=1 Tax=Geminicoccus sp. TaxID=2024832 RepID=UPI002E37A808|nr:DsbA family protein [Geminicoccus sp.]HEX2524858.1 DsbA family protein [Geminicoccus sp.]
MRLGLPLDDLPPGSAQLGLAADFACAWCRLTWHRLKQVARARQIGLCWLPFQVDPTIPPRGVPYRPWLVQRHGGASAADASLQRIRAAGAAEGLRFDLTAIRLQPNTGAAHRLVAAASRSGKGRRAVDLLFDGFFEQGRDIGDLAVLDSIAREVGVPRHGGEIPTIPIAVSAVGAVPVILDKQGDALVGCQPLESIRVFAELALCHPGPGSAFMSPARALRSVAQEGANAQGVQAS